MVLDVHVVWPVLDLVDAYLAGKNRVGHFSGRRKARRCRPPLPAPLPVALRGLAGEVNQTNVKARATQVSDGPPPGEGLTPYLCGFIGRALDVKNVGHEVMVYP